jgi:hypothetical protein
VVGSNALDGLRDLGLGVLDDVPLVQHRVIELQLLQSVNVVAHNVVRHDDELVLAEDAAQARSFSGGTEVLQGLGAGAAEAQHLVLPVANQRGRADHERGKGDALGTRGLAVSTPPFNVVAGQDAYRLQCLAEAHVVAQYAVQVVLVEEGHPIDALLLVLAQFSVDLDGQVVVVQLVAVEQLFQEVALLLLLFDQFLAEPLRIWYAALEGHETNQRRKAERDRLAHLNALIAHAAHDRNDQEDDVRHNVEAESIDDVWWHRVSHVISFVYSLIR